MNEASLRQRTRSLRPEVQKPAIHFVGRNMAERWGDHARLDESALSRDPDRFKGGTINWVFQTYLRLRESLLEAGIATSFGEDLRPGVINVAHRDSLNRWFTPYFRSYVVGVRADRPPVKVCDWEIVQNQLGDHGERQTHVPHWPQPGLTPRLTQRATRIERAAYFGRIGTTSRWLREERFKQQLADMGIEFSIQERAWSDYSRVDLVIAHRVESPTMLLQKPASKLVNAWLAGVPALLNREPAFVDLRRSALDYLEIDSAQDVFKMIEQLRAYPQLYEAMVRNGQERAREFSVEAVRERWMQCLLHRIVPDAMRALTSRQSGVTAIAVQAQRLLAQKVLSRRFKLRYTAENRARASSYR